MLASFEGTTKARIASLFTVVANKMNLPAMMPLGLMMLQSGGGIARQPASPANSGVSGEKVRVSVSEDAFVLLDGSIVEWVSGSQRSGSDEEGEDDDEDVEEEEEEEEEQGEASRRQKRIPGLPRIKTWKRGRVVDGDRDWIIRKAQWRLRVGRAEDEVQKVEVNLRAVRIEAFTGERERNRTRGFLV
jgi:hypothetical protein